MSVEKTPRACISTGTILSPFGKLCCISWFVASWIDPTSITIFFLSSSAETLLSVSSRLPRTRSSCVLYYFSPKVTRLRWLSFRTTILTHFLINDTMHHDRRIQTPLRPLSIDFTTTAQLDPRFTPMSGDTGTGTPQTAIPGGAAVLMKDSAGTSMALNLDIHPVYGTPLLSGQAITAKGDVLEVHPCSCNDPIASRHNLPMTATPGPSRGGSLFPEHNDPYPSPSSQSRLRQMPGSRPDQDTSGSGTDSIALISSCHRTLARARDTNSNSGSKCKSQEPHHPTPASVRRPGGNHPPTAKSNEHR
jgi:hypothetical protein